jgi:hypothetical protein
MAIQTIPESHKTAKPLVAGIFNIFIGSCCLLVVLGICIAATVVSTFSAEIPFSLPVLFALIALPAAAVGIISIIGGVFEMQRRSWGWALAGSITTTLVSNPLGIASIVLTALSKNEFAR